MNGRSAWVGIVFLALDSGCGGATVVRAVGEPGWPASPPTQTVMCGAPMGACDHSASVRVRWPEDLHAPSDAHVSIDEQVIAPAEIELGVCVAPGIHALRIATSQDEPEGTVSQRSAALPVEVLAGIETRVTLTRAMGLGNLGGAATLVPIDIGATVAALGDVELPTIAIDATPEERRVFAPVLAASFDAWRERLARVAALAESERDAVLHEASLDHEARSRAIALTIAEERPSADRLAAIRRAMQTETEDAASMIAIERACPVYSHRDAVAPLAPVSIEARPYTGTGTFVARLRVAIDDVEVLDVGSVSGDELFATTVVDGVVPPGEHTVMAEATFAPRPLGVVGGYQRRTPILAHQHVVIPETGGRIRVRALEVGTPTTPLEERLVVEITQ